MLLANYSQLNRNCYAMTANAFTNPVARFKPTLFNGFYAGDAIVTGETGKSAFANGYATTERGGTAWWLSPKAGGLACRTLTGSGDLTITSLSLGKDLSAALDGSGGISAASLALIVQLSAAITGSGTISAATLQAITDLSAALSGSGSVSDAALSLVVSLAADLDGSGELAGNLKGQLSMAADLTVTGTGLSTANVGAAVWAHAIESGYTAEEIVRLLAAYVAGNATGLESSPVFRDINDTKDRISGTISGETRTVDSLDAS